MPNPQPVLPPLRGVYNSVQCRRRIEDKTNPAMMRDFVRKCPQLNAAISKRHYLLPKVRQADYISQDFCDNHCRDLVLQWAMGRTEGKESLALETLNLVASIKYDRPTLYLERELGEKLVQTEVPGDFSTNEINWPWPAFRVMLPTGLVTAGTRPDGKPISALYLDLHLWDLNKVLGLSLTHLNELNRFFGGEGRISENSGIQHDATAFYLSALTDYQLPGYQPDTVTCLGSWDDWKLRDMIVSSLTTLKGSVGEVNHDLLAKLRAMMFNLLLFFSQEPVSVFKDDWVRKPRTEGKHQLSGLLPARFVGDCMPKLRVNPPVVVKADSEPTGQTHAPHWVRGFWKRVVYGKGRLLRKRQWILPYKTGRDEEKHAL